MKKIKFICNNYQGFTLSELLAVVAILSILAVMATGSFRLAIEKSRFTEGLQAAEKIAAAVDRFYYDNPSLPYEARISPTMDDLDIAFSKSDDCYVTKQLKETSSWEEEFCPSGVDCAAEGMTTAAGIADAKEFSDRCRKIGDFEIIIVPNISHVSVRAYRRRSYIIARINDEDDPDHDFGTASYYGLQLFNKEGTFRGFSEYELVVFPSFLQGQLERIKKTEIAGPVRDIKKHVYCTGHERLCMGMGFTEKQNSSKFYKP